MSRKPSDADSRILHPQSPAEIQWRNAVRFFFEYLPLAALIMLVAIVIRAAYHQPASNQFTSEEVSRLRKMAEQPRPSDAIPPAPAAKQLSPEEVEKLRSQAQPATTPTEQFTPADAQALKGLAANSKQLDRLADNSNDLLSKKLDAEDIARLKEDVQRYLEWVIAIAGIFAIAQTLAAGFAAQSFTRQADRDLAELKELENDFSSKAKNAISELEKFKEKYSVLARAGQAQLETFNILSKFFPEDKWVDWRTGFYGEMLVTERQAILSADRYLGYDLLLMQGTDPDPGTGLLHLEHRKLRGLANFYTSKFEHENKLQSGQWQDLERAHHLLEFWLFSHPMDFQLQNDLAVVLVRCADYCLSVKKFDLEAEFREKARVRFDNSARLHPEQQRAYFNLSRIALDSKKPRNWPSSPASDEFRRGLSEAEKLAVKALALSNWEFEPDAKMRTEIEYNLACFRAISYYCDFRQNPSANPGDTNFTQRAGVVIDALEKIAGPQKGTILKRYVDADFDTDGGDLRGFRNHIQPADRDRLDKIRTGLSAHADEKTVD